MHTGFLYAPRGPIFRDGDYATLEALVDAMRALAEKRGDYMIRIDPMLEETDTAFLDEVRRLGFTVNQASDFSLFQPRKMCIRDRVTASSGAIERALEAIPQDRSYCLHAADGTVLSESAGFPREAAQNGRAGVIVSRVQNTTSGSRLITTSLLTLYGGTYSCLLYTSRCV